LRRARTVEDGDLEDDAAGNEGNAEIEPNFGPLEEDNVLDRGEKDGRLGQQLGFSQRKADFERGFRQDQVGVADHLLVLIEEIVTGLDRSRCVSEMEQRRG